MRELDDLFKLEAQEILVYTAKEVEIDPNYHTKETTYYNPIPIEAVIIDLTATQIKWKTLGLSTSRAKEIIIRYEDKDKIESSKKIEIDGIEYLGWKQNGKLQYRKAGNYLRCYVYTE